MSPRQLLPNAHFWPPATEDQIAAVENELGARLPGQLRRLYLDCDGLREDRGNSKYLLSLTDNDFIGSPVRLTRFYWEDWTDFYPDLDLRPFVFFGSSSCNQCWGIDWKGGQQIIAYHHDMGGEYEVVGSDILEVWRSDYSEYDKIDLV